MIDWALTVAHLETRLGTKLELTPVVLHVNEEMLERLLAKEHPELALVAAWAVSHRHGEKAQNVVAEALALTERLPERLREAQRNAILSLLGERLLAWLEEMKMNPEKIPMSPAAQRVKAVLAAERAAIIADAVADGERQGLAAGLVKGKRETLLVLLAARGLTATAEERATIEACSDPARLDQWVVKAMSAGSVAEVLGANGKGSANG